MTTTKLVKRLFACSAVAAALLTTTGQADVPRLDRVRVVETPRAIADAALINEEAQPIRLQELRGKVAFVLFGFTNCADVCPLAMERLAQLHDSGSLSSADVSYVMISVDGERDTPEALKAFLAKYSPDFVGLTADPARVKPIAAQFAAAFFKGAHVGHDGHYDVAHSPQIFVLDPAGNLRAELYGASLEAMSGVARALLEEAKR